MSRLRGDDEGATAVEMAMVLLPVLLLLGGTLTFALHLTYAGLADHAAREGLRTATVHHVDGFADLKDVADAVDGLFPSDLLGSPSVLTLRTIGSTSADGQGDLVQVTVTYQVPGISTAADLVPDFIPGNSLKSALASLATITRTASGRRE